MRPCHCRTSRGTSSPARSPSSASTWASIPAGRSATGSRPPSSARAGAATSAARATSRSATDQSQPGFTHWGSFAEYVAIDEAELNLIRLPDSLGFVEAASLGCRFATAYRAIVSRSRLAPGEQIAVHGCGGVGLSAIMIAVAAGVKVYGVDVSDAALAAAEKLGAVPVRGGEGAAARILEASGGGVDVSVDASAAPRHRSRRCGASRSAAVMCRSG